MNDYKHSVSVILVENMNRLQSGEITKQQLLSVVNSLEAISIDEKQRNFFKSFYELLEQFEKTISESKNEKNIRIN
jgi:hypothetical protein